MVPLRFEPIYQSYVWGGDRISQEFHRNNTPSPCAESWEVSDRPDGMSVVATGLWKGHTLQALIAKWGETLLGKDRHFIRFPLLVKLIDAKEHLSIQVHPDEETAKILGGEPKTESWIILKEGSIYAGLKEDSETRIRQAIRNQEVESFVQKHSVQAKEVIHIPSGRIHAICAECLLLEVQQNSNTTYRLYDWSRTSRKLHIEEALASIHWTEETPIKMTPHLLETNSHFLHESLIQSPYFQIERTKVTDHWSPLKDCRSFQILFCSEGEGIIEVDGTKESFCLGMTYLIPAAASSTILQGNCEAIRIRLP